MSAGEFVLGFYEADSGEIHAARAQAESAALSIGGTSNAFAAGPPTSPFWVKASQGKRAFGLSMRRVRIRWTAAAPDGYKGGAELSIPVYTSAAYNGMTLGETGTYLGSACKVVGKSGEAIFPEI